MDHGINSGLIAFVIIACCWYMFVMYYALKSWKSVLCYTVLPVLGICATGLTFAMLGIQHIFPHLLLAAPLLGAAIGVYIGYRIDHKGV
jgi:peptidoglycan/LPS O-acetylase OafA/YrhL